ncbi:replicative DNA helicase [Demequina capsici]|uniref:Replicative DNA helicase n=1 Tax=Demequina capsici TaxID=3075620 RepID=A0AA96JAC3_9MICO|nr:replicative DNA helicase [Demequina sp. PMTSA13]WNM27285.1 replicative DNA helicase [Demequina sp. PMTSA13]
MSIDELESSYNGPTTFDRLPPQNLEAEQSVLGAMLLSKDAMADVIETVRADDFYKPAHELIFDVATKLYNGGDPVDALTVSAELQRTGQLSRIGGAEYLHTLIATVPSAASAGYYARLVREQSILRRLVEAGTRIANMGYDGDGGEVDLIVDGAQAEIFAVTERRNSDDYLPIGDILESTLGQIDQASKHDGSLKGVPTGFRDLDDLTGGLQGGQMIVIAARPAIGKSTLGLDIARSASIHHNIASVIFSLEMSKEEITKRMLSSEGNVKLTQLNKGPLGPSDWDRLARASSRVSTAPLFIDDSPNMTLMEIRAKCRRLKQQHNLGLVVLDYLQLMSSGRKVESRQQEVSEFSRALKLLAKEIEVPVIAISQLNRGSEQRGDKKPMLSDMRESGAIEQDADIVILLHREDAYDRDNRPGEADFIVAKHRAGPTDTIAVAFKKDYAHFADMAPEM